MPVSNNSLDDVIGLEEAVAVRRKRKLPPLTPQTLAKHARAGRLIAKLIGITWVTTREHAAAFVSPQAGRPKGA